MADVCEQGSVEVDRGPDWLFLRIHPGRMAPEGVADELWALAERHFIYRLVLEMDDVDALPSELINQLVKLQDRVALHQGALRLCGLNRDCAQELSASQHDQILSVFENREDAVHCERHHKVH